jgi:hypothetical protein
VTRSDADVVQLLGQILFPRGKVIGIDQWELSEGSPLYDSVLGFGFRLRV